MSKNVTSSVIIVGQLSTGIGVIDKLLNGGLEKGSSVLVRSSPFVNSAPFFNEWLYNRLSANDVVFYYVNNKPPETVTEAMRNYGWSIEKFRDGKKFSFIDSYSALVGTKSSEAYSIRDPSNINQLNEVMSPLISEKRDGNTTLFIDSLNTLIDQYDEPALDMVENWCKLGSASGVISVCLYMEWGYPDSVKAKLENIFNSIIDLKALPKIVANEALTVSKTRNLAVKEPQLLLFKYAKPGGFRVYVPKILVTGPFHAGKTSVVHALSTRAVSVQRLGTTVALDFGHVDHEGFAVDLFGSVGQARFDPLLEKLGGEALGVLLVVDSTKPEDFPRALEMLHKAKVHGLPYVIVANKQDLPGALSMEQIREKLHLSESVQVIKTIATEKSSVFPALDVLLKKLVEGSS
ncbi:MAG: ADP-ribosylation factor-like protein [Candidatus Bathyarchaeota archaeon]